MRERLRGRVLKSTGEREAREYWYAGTETGDNQIGGWTYLDTRRTYMKEVSRKEGTPPQKELGQG